jgi:hypothetical protein
MAAWRLRRLYEIESGFLRISLLDRQEDFDDDYVDLLPGEKLGFIVRRDSNGDDVMLRLSRYEARLERSFYRALHELERLRSRRAGSEPSQPQLALLCQSSSPARKSLTPKGDSVPRRPLPVASEPPRPIEGSADTISPKEYEPTPEPAGSGR